MYFKYGDHQHPDNEVTLASFSIVPKRSSRGFRMSTLFEMHIAGEILGSSQSDLTTKINELITAYSDDFKDAGFYQDDDSPTPHVLTSNHPDNLTGNIITYRNWPIGDGAEYATRRTFSIGIQAEFANAYSQFIHYQDTISRTGDCGSIIEWVNLPTGDPTYTVEANKSYQLIRHSGEATALSFYPLAPAPLLDRPFYLGHLSNIQYIGPRRYAQGYREFTTRWQYTYITTSDFPVYPTLRAT